MTGDRDRPRLLALFPSLHAFGGIQASGREAIETLRGLADEGLLGDAHCFESPSLQKGIVGKVAVAHAASKDAMNVRTRFKNVLVWHLSLVKLLPLYRTNAGKLVVFLHGVEAWRHHPFLVQRLLERTKLFLTNSQYTWERFAESNPALRRFPYRLVPLGLGSPLVGQGRPPDERPMLLMLSRLIRAEDYKGHREVITAWPRVLSRVPTAELVIAGSGDLLPDLKRLALEVGVAANVHFTGGVQEAEKETLLTRCRALAMPSRGEGFGLAYLEAMRVGRPSLVSNCDGGREVVAPPEAGLAVEVTDPGRVAASIVELLTPGPMWQRWSQKARERYEGRYTAQQFRARLKSALIETFELRLRTSATAG